MHGNPEREEGWGSKRDCLRGKRLRGDTNNFQEWAFGGDSTTTTYYGGGHFPTTTKGRVPHF